MSRSSAASAASGKPGRAAARAAATASASGSRAHRPAISSTASGSAAARAAPSRAVSSLRGLAVAEHVKGEQPGAVGGGQPGQLVAAGDQDQAAGLAGQQRPDLLRRRGRCPARSASACRPAGCGTGAACASRPARDPLRRHAERVQEPADRLGGRRRRTGGVEAAQVHIQLPVGEPVGDLVRPVHGQRGLAHPGRPADRRRSPPLRGGVAAWLGRIRARASVRLPGR